MLFSTDGFAGWGNGKWEGYNDLMDVQESSQTNSAKEEFENGKTFIWNWYRGQLYVLDIISTILEYRFEYVYKAAICLLKRFLLKSMRQYSHFMGCIVRNTL